MVVLGSLAILVLVFLLLGLRGRDKKDSEKEPGE